MKALVMQRTSRKTPQKIDTRNRCARKESLTQNGSFLSEPFGQPQKLNQVKGMTLDSRRRRGQSARRIGYARVSTEDQNLALQLDALKRVGCEIIFKDKGVSGLSHSRPGLDKALAALGRGSDFVIWAVDRLGRDMGHLNRTAREFREQGIGFQSVCEHIDLETPEGRLNFNIRAAYAEYERDVISTRTKAGMAAAKARGIRLGRPRKLSEGQIARARKQVQRDGQEVRKIARKLGVSPVTLARALKEETA